MIQRANERAKPALDANLIDKRIFDQLQAMAMKTGRKISAFQRYLKQANKQTAVNQQTSGTEFNQ